MNKINLNETLLLNEPSLKQIDNPFERFYIYRAMPNSEVQDCDRSKTSKDIYKSLGWFDEAIDFNLLEPDTFFASSHNIIHELFNKNKQDKDYYVNDFKNYCINKGIDYDGLKYSDPALKYNRYLWMIEPNVKKHYDFFISNSSLMNYIEATHKIGNFMIIPKFEVTNKLGSSNEKPQKLGAKKAFKFKECPIKSLQYIQDNWGEYTDNYHGITFEEFKKLYILEDCYANGSLKNSLVIDTNQSFADIFKALDEVTKLINDRNHKITIRLSGKI